MTKKKFEKIREKILGIHVNGAWFCNKCQEINPMGTPKCSHCNHDCNFIKVGYTNWIKIGFPLSIILGISLMIGLLFLTYRGNPNYPIEYFISPIIFSSVLIIGCIFLCLFFETNSLLPRVYTKKGIEFKGSGAYVSKINKSIDDKS